ncbi:hypothetical protein ABER75_01530 [Niallia taxi]
MKGLDGVGLRDTMEARAKHYSSLREQAIKKPSLQAIILHLVAFKI